MSLGTDIHHILTTPDVLIIGGGTAGVAAAVGVAQSGASSVIIERNSYFGGKATAAYVGTVCGLFLTGPQKESEFIVKGFAKTFAQRLMILSDTKPEFQKGGLWFFPYDRNAFMHLCDEYVLASVQSQCLHSYVHMVGYEQHTISEVDVMVHNHPLKFYPKTIIDTSGEALISTLTETECIKSDRYQAAAQVFGLTSLASNDAATISLALGRSVKKGIENGLLPKGCEKISLVPGTVKNGNAFLKLGIPHEVNNSAQCVAEIELFAKQAVYDITNYLKSNSEIFHNAVIEMIAPEAGIRTGPRHLGKYKLNEKDVLSCRKFSDGIARGSWPIEYWEPGKNVEMTFFKEDDFYEIPAGCLKSAAFENLFFAGRSISTDDKAIASARVIGTCLQTGFAAGMLAGGYAKNENEESVITAIQNSQFSLTVQ